MVEKRRIDHGRFVNDDDPGFQGIVSVFFESARTHVVFEKTVNGLSFEPGGFLHALGGPAGGCGKVNGNARPVVSPDDRFDDRRFSRARTARHAQNFLGQGEPDRLLLGLIHDHAHFFFHPAKIFFRVGRPGFSGMGTEPLQRD